MASPVDLQRHLRPLMRNLGIAAFAALLAVMLALGRGSAAGLGIGVLVFLSAGFCGATLGFLFAVPKLLDAELPGQRLLGGNDNVSRVSDWLTTMLVGVGLTQLNNIDSGLVRFRQLLEVHARVFGSGANASAGALPVIGPMLLVLGVVAGFLYLYLHTRIELVTGFREAEEVLTGADADTVKAAVAAVASGSVLSRELAAKSAVTVSDSIAVMLKALYDTANQGFERVIDIGKALATTEATARADYWFYLAAAYGQMYAASNGADPKILKNIELDALQAAERAVRIDPGYKARLKAIAVPGGADDDLAPFADTPPFKAIVE